MKTIQVDFSLALINRTGAYHAGVDLLAGAGDLVDGVRYWRFFLPETPKGAPGKILGKLMLRELALGPTSGWDAWPLRSVERPMLFLDPLYVMRADLRPTDMVLCHDVGPITHKDLFFPSTTAMYEKAYAKIAAIKPRMAFPSRASMLEFQALYGADYPMQEVVQPGLRQKFLSKEMTQPEGVSDKFLLMVGALERRKNHVRVMEAFKQLKLAERGFQLIIVGPRGIDSDVITETAAATPGVKMLGFVADPELRWLFANAKGFLLPSLLEGFGVPAVEAAAHGLPSLLTRGALEEAVDGAGVFCDPLSTDSVAQGLEEILSLTPERRSAMVAHAQARGQSMTVERFQENWRATMRKLLESQSA